MDEITENDLTPLVNNQNKVIKYIKIKQVFDKLEKNLINDFKFIFGNSQSNDLNNGINYK